MMLGIQVLIVGLIFGIIGLILHFVFDCKFGEFYYDGNEKKNIKGHSNEDTISMLIKKEQSKKNNKK